MKKIILLIGLFLLTLNAGAIEDINYNGVLYEDVGFNYSVNVSGDLISIVNYTSLNLPDGRKYSSGVWLSNCYYNPNIQCFVNRNTSMTDCGKPLYPCLAELITDLPICITVLDLTPSTEDFLNDCFANYSEEIYYDGWFNYACSEDLLNVSNEGIINDLTFRNHCDPEYLGTGFNSGYDVCNKSLFHYVIQENSTNNETVFSKAYLESFICENLSTTTTTTTPTTTTTTEPGTTTTEPPTTTTSPTTTTTTLPDNLNFSVIGNGTPIPNTRENISGNESSAEAGAYDYIEFIGGIFPLFFLMIIAYAFMNMKGAKNDRRR